MDGMALFDILILAAGAGLAGLAALQAARAAQAAREASRVRVTARPRRRAR